jgi:hypothetical protein
MAITLNNSVQNINNTPGIITDVYANLPLAAQLSNGTLFISTDTKAILTVVNGVWVQVAKG